MVALSRSSTIVAQNQCVVVRRRTRSATVQPRQWLPIGIQVPLGRVSQTFAVLPNRCDAVQRGKEASVQNRDVAWHSRHMRDHTYVARYGWSSRDLFLLPCCVIFIAVGTAMAVTDEPVLGALGILLGAAYVVLWAINFLSRRVALAVTAEGITFGLMPPWSASRTAFVPWSDVEAVVLWRQGTGAATVRSSESSGGPAHRRCPDRRVAPCFGKSTRLWCPLTCQRRWSPTAAR